MALGSSRAESLRQWVTVGAWPWKQRVTQRSGEELPKKPSAKTRSQPSALHSLTERRNTEEDPRRHEAKVKEPQLEPRPRDEACLRFIPILGLEEAERIPCALELYVQGLKEGLPVLIGCCAG